MPGLTIYANQRTTAIKSACQIIGPAIREPNRAQDEHRRETVSVNIRKGNTILNVSGHFLQNSTKTAADKTEKVIAAESIMGTLTESF